MVKRALLDADVKLGDKILVALDAAKFPISVAIWIFTEEDGWQLMVATSLYETHGLAAAYRSLFAALSKDDPESADSADVRLIGSRDPFVRDLRKLVGKAPVPKLKRLSGYRIGGITFEDAVVYRIK